MTVLLTVLLALLGATEAFAAAPVDCSAQKFRTFRTSAQSLAPSTPALGDELMSCPALRPEVVLWLRFFHVSRGDYAALQTLDRRFGNAGAPGPREADRDRAMRLANEKRCGDLEAAVQSKRPMFHDDAEVLLTLARCLAQTQKLEKSRDIYDRYLALKADDDEVRVERTYTYLWAGDPTKALTEFDSLLATSLSPEARSSAQRGVEFAKAKSGDAAVEGSTMLDFVAESYVTSDEYSRRGLGVTWRSSPWWLALRSHTIEGEALSLPVEHRATEAEVGGRWQLLRGLHLEGSGGAFVATKPTITHTLALSAAAPDQPGGWHARAGSTASPLIKYVALDDDDAAARDHTYFAELGWRPHVRYRYESHKIEHLSPYTRQFLDGEIPAKERADGSLGLMLRYGVRHARHDHPNPLIYSPWRETFVYGGLGLKARPSSKARLKGRIDYGAIALKVDEAEDRYRYVAIYGGALEGEYDLGRQTRLFLNSEWSRSENRQILSIYHSTFIQVGLTWLVDETFRDESSVTTEVSP